MLLTNTLTSGGGDDARSGPITDTKTISNLFNNYFCTVGENLQKNIKNNPNDSYKSYMPSLPKDSMYCAPVSAAEICDIIKNMHVISLLGLTILVHVY